LTNDTTNYLEILIRSPMLQHISKREQVKDVILIRFSYVSSTLA